VLAGTNPNVPYFQIHCRGQAPSEIVSIEERLNIKMDPLHIFEGSPAQIRVRFDVVTLDSAHRPQLNLQLHLSSEAPQRSVRGAEPSTRLLSRLQEEAQ